MRNLTSDLFIKANLAGMEAAKKCIPVPMQVVQHANPMDDASPIIKEYPIETEGACGFAWVKIKGLRGNDRALAIACGFKPDSYEPGLTLWVNAYGQSVARKEAYANAYALILKEAGLRAYGESRLD